MAAVLLVLALGACRGAAPAPVSAPNDAPSNEKAQLTILFFGLSSADGAGVSEQQWQAFLETVVTPSFPDGLTVLDAHGQYLDRDRQVAAERAKVLMLVHPGHAPSQDRISSVIAQYKNRFQQDSVLRVDSVAKVRY